jgi:hypothetical protein
MKTKTIILITWPVSVVLVAWLGCIIGTRFGIQLGIAQFHNERVRRFQLDLSDVAGSSNERTRQILQATGYLAGEMGGMGDTGRYAAASKEFAQKIQELQNHAVEPTRTLPGASDSP